MPIPSLEMYNAIYSPHYIQIPAHTNDPAGRTYSNHSSIEVCRMMPRNGNYQFSQKKEFCTQSRSASTLHHNGTKHVQNGQSSGRTYYNKKEYWNSKSQGKNKRLQHGNSAPCLVTAVTDDTGDSGESRSSTPSRHQPESHSSTDGSAESIIPSYPNKKECSGDAQSSFSNGQATNNRLTHPQRRDPQFQQKRRNNYNNNASNNNYRNQGAFFRNRRISTSNSIILHSFPSPYPPGYTFFTPILTPPDRFLMRSHLMQVSEMPKDLMHGSVWDQLSHSTWHKFYANQQSQCTYEKKILLWKHLFLHFKQYFPKYGLYLVGSTMNGFGSNYSDVDLCLLVRYAEVDQRNEALSYLSNILKLLEHSDFVEKPELIQAKVPLLKFRDSKEGLLVDLNCNNSVGIRNTHLLYCYGQMDWRVKPLVLVVKLWAQWHNINDAKRMTISSYSIVLMVIHFLQCGVNPHVLPCLHSMYPGKFNLDNDIVGIDIHEELELYESKNKQPLGELLLQFFQYYASFDYHTCAISVRSASVIPIEECRQVRSLKNDPHQWKCLCIEEPFDLTNTARSVYDPDKFESIKSIIVRTAQVLFKTKKLDSIFNHDVS